MPNALPRFEPADRRQTLTDQIASILRDRVMSGDLVPGARLPGEQQLAEAFEVSRTVVREAIARLRVDGLITSRQGLGTFVADNLAAPRLDADSLQGNKRVAFVFELRSIMEPDIVGLAARRVDLGIGKGAAKVWTCDLTKEYVAINGDYRS